MAERYFDREEAEGLLPLIKGKLSQALELRRAIASLDEELTQASTRIMLQGGTLPPYKELVLKKAEREQRNESLEDAINKIQETGCVVKDLEMGLVDFPALIHGEEAYLCWKLGEVRIGFWHGLNEGFAGRKPLEDTAPGGSGPSRIH
jgi:hypothetical protein